MEPSFQGRNTPDQIWVYYSGTDALKEGYLLCFKNDATVDGTTNTDRWGTTAVKPATANLMFPAGIVVNAITGPGWVRVHRLRRGDNVKAQVKANATSGSTLLGGVNNQYELGSIAQSGADLAVIALAIVTADTSSTAALKLVQLL